MAVTETYEPVLLETDGDETDFDFDFSVFADTDLVVALIDPDTLEVLDEPELGVDYTVTLNTSTVGGTVVFGTAPEDDQLVSIRRNIPTTQGTDIPSGGLFRESQIENALDKAILLIQQLEEQISRALLQNPYTEALDLQLPAPEASKGLSWNAAGDALENVEVPAAALAGALAAQAAAEAAQAAAEAAQAAAESAAGAIGLLTAALTSGTTVATDASLVQNGGVFTLTAAHDFTLSNPTNPVAGKKLVWRIQQDGTGSRILTLGDKFTVASEISSVVLSTAAGAIDHIGAIYKATTDKWEVVAFSSEQA